MDIYERLTPIFQDVFDNDDIVLSPGLKASQVEGWDSLGHVRLVVAMERALSNTPSTAEITGLVDVGQLVQFIELKLS
jgi:acyl carrier protein